MVQKINNYYFDKDQFIQKLQAAGITAEELESARSMGTESFKELLAANGIQGSQPPSPPPNDDFAKKLEAAGISKEEFHTAFMQGPEAVKKLLQSHGIEQPSKPQGTEGRGKGGHDDFIKKMEAAGITKAEFEAAMAKGKDAVDQLLKSHGIQPPNMPPKQ